MATLYILYSQRLNRYYIGSTDRFEERFQEHQRGQTRATRNGCPWEVALEQACETYEIAYAKEMKLKRWKSRAMVERVILEGKMTA